VTAQQLPLTRKEFGTTGRRPDPRAWPRLSHLAHGGEERLRERRRFQFY